MWDAHKKPVDLAEHRLTEAILDGTFPAGSQLPPERELAGRLGVTRPTLREALQRLRRDGWVDVQHGRSTRVCDYRTEGRLGVLAGLTSHFDRLGSGFVRDLLQVRATIAPAFLRLAAERDPAALLEPLAACEVAVHGAWGTFARADWALLQAAAVASGNLIYPLIFNGFEDLHAAVAEPYYRSDEGREVSRVFYAGLRRALESGDAEAAEAVTRHTMVLVLDTWPELVGGAA